MTEKHQHPGLVASQVQPSRTRLASPSEQNRRRTYKSCPVGVYVGKGVNRPGEHPNWCEALYDAQAAALVLYGRALGLSHGESEDVLHEVFAALLVRETRPDRPEHYLVRAFRNRALNRRTSLWRRLTRELESTRWFERQEPESHREEAAMRCLAALPPEQREVLVLKFWHRHTFEEIGELLDISPNTAAGRYRYGLQKIRHCLSSVSHEADIPESALTLDTEVSFSGAAPSSVR